MNIIQPKKKPPKGRVIELTPPRHRKYTKITKIEYESELDDSLPKNVKNQK